MINSNYKKTRNELEENNIQKLFFGTKEQSAMKTHASKLIFFCSVWRTTEKKTTISEMLLYILHKKKGIRKWGLCRKLRFRMSFFQCYLYQWKKYWCDPKLEANLHNLEFKNLTEQRNLACITLDIISK